MKYLNKIILISLIISLNFIGIETVCYAQTEYDEEQDDLIENNTDDIADNADDIADNANNFVDNAENIATNTSNISSNDTDIATNATNITNNRGLINNNSQRLDNHEGRIEDLEETEMNLVGEVQFIRAKNHTVSTYTKYDVRHSRVPEVGLKLTIGLGKSWTQKELERLEVKLNKIEKLLHKVAGEKEPIETKMIKTGNGYSIVIDEGNTTKLLKKF